MAHREFETGATRDTDEGKLDYEGFFSPLVMLRFAEYMHENREQPDGFRESDNWQKGIPQEAYMKSKYRHFMDTWLHHRGLADLAGSDLERALCAELFNTMGYLHTILEAKRAAAAAGDVTCCEDCRDCADPSRCPDRFRPAERDTHLTPEGDDRGPTASDLSRGAQMRAELERGPRKTWDQTELNTMGETGGSMGVYSG